MNKRDERVRETRFPVRLVKTFGNVKNADALLCEQSLQITTDEPDCATLINSGKEKAAVLLDFGRELHGAVRLLCFTNFAADSGISLEHAHPTVRVCCGESVGEALSTVDIKGATNDHSPRDITLPLPQYSDITLCETGFRFVYLELISDNVKMNLRSVAATAIYRDIPYLGTFRSSDETLNKIYDTAAYTCHLNMQNYIWDGIKRDRLVWIGDMYPEMLTVKTVFGKQSVLEESLRFARDSTPLPNWMNGFPTYSLWWVMIVYDWYFYTGEWAFLSEFKDYAIALLHQVCEHVNDDGTDTLPAYFLDWPCHSKPQEISGVRSLLVVALLRGASLAELFGDKSTADLCRKKAEAVRSVEEHSFGAKQVAAMLSLAGKCDKKAAADEILAGGARGFSTFMSYFLLKAACAGGMAQTLAALREYYGGMLSMGATTFWEDFDIDWMRNAAPIDTLPKNGMGDIHGDNGAFCYVGYRHSLCHGWASAPTAFLAEEVLGIHIEEAGCKKIRLSPDLGDLDRAEGTYPLPQGILTVKHKKNPDGTVSTEYTAPDGVEIIY